VGDKLVVSVVEFSACFLGEQAVKSNVNVKVNRIRNFFIVFDLGMIGIDGLKLREKYYFNNPSKSPLISLSLGLGASSSIIFPILSINIYLGMALILNRFFNGFSDGFGNRKLILSGIPIFLFA
jgi:hypothetical protein